MNINSGIINQGPVSGGSFTVNNGPVCNMQGWSTLAAELQVLADDPEAGREAVTADFVREAQEAVAEQDSSRLLACAKSIGKYSLKLVEKLSLSVLAALIKDGLLP